MFYNNPSTEMTDQEYKIGLRITAIAIGLYLLLVLVCNTTTISI